MKRLILIFLLIPSLAWGAITSIASIGTANSIVDGTSLAITTSANLEAGNIGLVIIATDNLGSADGDNSDVKSVADDAGNTYTKLCEYSYTEAGAGNGATAALYFTKATAQLDSGQTVTITFSGTVHSKAAQLWEFTVGAGNTLQLAGTCQTEGVNGTGGDGTGSLAISGLSNIERLYVRAVAHESNAVANLTVTTDYTVIPFVRAEETTQAASMRSLGEFIIVTATESTSDPTLTTSLDAVSIFIALEEVPVGGGAVRRPIIIIQ